MIKRVKARGYKSLKDIDIKLNRLTVVVGANASGKSNLFDLLNLVSRMATKSTLPEAFDEHRGDPIEAFHLSSDVKELIRGGTAEFDVEIDVELSDSVVRSAEANIKKMREGVSARGNPKKLVIERQLRYNLTVEIQTDSGNLRVKDEKLCALRKDGKETKSRRAFIERVGNKIHIRMEGQAARPFQFDIGLDRTIVSTPLYAPHYPHITAFKQELSRWCFYYLEPDIMRKENALKNAPNLGLLGSDLAAFYNTLKRRDLKRFEANNRALKLLLPAVEKIDIQTTETGQLLLIAHENGARFTSRVVSDGTLRILALLAITNPLEPSTVVGYEEPENGVHPRRLKLIADLFREAAEQGETQYIINTHSAILPDYFDESQIVVCKKENYATSFKPFKTLALWQHSDIEKALDDASVFSEGFVRGYYGG